MALAKWHLERKEKKAFEDAMEKAAKALPETSSAGDFTGSRIRLRAAVAGLYLDAGDTASALPFLDEAVKCLEAENAKAGEDRQAKSIAAGLPGYGEVAGLLLRAGGIDKAVGLANRPDGSLAPGAVPLFVQAYVDQGQSKELKAILDKCDPALVECMFDLCHARAAADFGTAGKPEHTEDNK